jgi:hypothetical protein
VESHWGIFGALFLESAELVDGAGAVDAAAWSIGTGINDNGRIFHQGHNLGTQ